MGTAVGCLLHLPNHWMRDSRPVPGAASACSTSSSSREDHQPSARVARPGGRSLPGRDAPVARRGRRDRGCRDCWLWAQADCAVHAKAQPETDPCCGPLRARPPRPVCARVSELLPAVCALEQFTAPTPAFATTPGQAGLTTPACQGNSLYFLPITCCGGSYTRNQKVVPSSCPSLPDSSLRRRAR